ncbi:MAG: hypothetical protein DMG56_09885, partial [Acidobacteria bacterium]
YFDTNTWASSPGPAIPRSMGRLWVANTTNVSQRRFVSAAVLVFFALASFLIDVGFPSTPRPETIDSSLGLVPTRQHRGIVSRHFLPDSSRHAHYRAGSIADRIDSGLPTSIRNPMRNPKPHSGKPLL